MVARKPKTSKRYGLQNIAVISKNPPLITISPNYENKK